MKKIVYISTRKKNCWEYFVGNNEDIIVPRVGEMLAHRYISGDGVTEDVYGIVTRVQHFMIEDKTEPAYVIVVEFRKVHPKATGEFMIGTFDWKDILGLSGVNDGLA